MAEWLARMQEIAGLMVGCIVLVVLPILHLIAASRLKSYKDHGERTGEW